MIIRLMLIVIAVLLGLVVVNWLWQLLRAVESRGRRQGQGGQWSSWGGTQGGRQAGAVPRSGEPMVQDPYCRTYLPKSSALVVEVGGRTHYFCSRSCADKFQEQETVAGRR
jgi:YHS domain-containing protein